MRSQPGKPKAHNGSALQAGVSGEGNEVVFLEMQSESDPRSMVCQVSTFIMQQPADSADMLSGGSEAD